jgi:GAF domain-containing protein
MEANDNLATRLFEVASLFADSVPLDKTMQRLVAYALDLIRSADGAVVTLLEDGRPGITVATDDLVARADQVHAVVGEGPAHIAREARRLVTSPSLGGDPAFPRFGSRVARLGLHSVVCTPLTLPDTFMGVITIYSRSKHAFGEGDVRVLQRYARPAAVVARNAQVLASSQRQIEQLNEALRIRPVVDQAIGIIRSRTGTSEAEAFDRLRKISQTRHAKVADVASELVEAAVRYAQDRGHEPTAR